jgi:hypothetical protein
MRKWIAALIATSAVIIVGCGGSGMRASVEHLCAPDKGIPAWDVCVKSAEDMIDAEIAEIEEYIKDK